MQAERRVAEPECRPYIQLQVAENAGRKQSLAAQVAAPAGITFGEVVPPAAYYRAEYEVFKESTAANRTRVSETRAWRSEHNKQQSPTSTTTQPNQQTTVSSPGMQYPRHNWRRGGIACRLAQQETRRRLFEQDVDTFV